MGGSTFMTTDGVVTPRMKPEVYSAMRDRCQARLRQLFKVVETPIEGPAKSSFGDVDILVALERKDALPLLGDAESPYQAIRDALGAIKSKSNCDHQIALAVPWPSDFPHGAVRPQDENAADDLKSGCTQCIQVDVHICKTLEQLQWLLFRHAHGDLWVIIGSMIRPAGLTIDEVGLHIRIPEIEGLDKKQARVLLSTDQRQITSFLGLDDRSLAQCFDSDEALFEYMAKCRLLHPHENTTGKADTSSEAKHKSNERKRPMFRKWFHEYLPAHPIPTAAPTRDTVRQEAFAHFPGSQPAYEARLHAWRLKEQRRTFWKDVIKPAIPAGVVTTRRGSCAAALKKIILEDDAGFAGIVAPPSLKTDDGLFDEAAVRVWVERNWQGVSDAAEENNKRRCAAAQKARGATQTSAVA
ncbi:hypothetical protein GGS21DRAFT_241986 [Xylaria nigripes]|nr:hypothetical protein GGS21DRAFT_241986 [Xylaria nigripes]